MGIFQKQASAYFHAKSGLVEVAGNVVFNGPVRANPPPPSARLAAGALPPASVRAPCRWLVTRWLCVVAAGLCPQRAMYNFNDGMIGGDNVHGNLLANAVREAGDKKNTCLSLC